MKQLTVKFMFLIAGLAVSTTLLTSCGNKKANEELHHAEGDTTTHHEDIPIDSAQTAYACPMHPEVTGKDGDECSKCRMKLEPVKGADSTQAGDGH